MFDRGYTSICPLNDNQYVDTEEKQLTQLKETALVIATCAYDQGEIKPNDATLHELTHFGIKPKQSNFRRQLQLWIQHNSKLLEQLMKHYLDLSMGLPSVTEQLTENLKND